MTPAGGNPKIRNPKTSVLLLSATMKALLVRRRHVPRLLRAGAAAHKPSAHRAPHVPGGGGEPTVYVKGFIP